MDLRKEYDVTLSRWERYDVLIRVKALDAEHAARIAKKAARSMDYDGWDGEAEVDNRTRPKLENNIEVTEVNQ